MKRYTLFLYLLLTSFSLQAQENSPKVRWFFCPEMSVMVHSNHLGLAPGFTAGASILQERLHVGFFFYGRSGPINGHTERLDLAAGQEYKGQSSINVRADHGAFGIKVAPQFPLMKGKMTLDVPVLFGQMGAGFYLFGENRKTPDGRRVSEWENELMNNSDAGFALMVEGGLRLRFRISDKDRIEAGLGLHYTQALGWETLLGGTDYYNVPRISIFLNFGN